MFPINLCLCAHALRSIFVVAMQTASSYTFFRMLDMMEFFRMLDITITTFIILSYVIWSAIIDCFNHHRRSSAVLSKPDDRYEACQVLIPNDLLVLCRDNDDNNNDDDDAEMEVVFDQVADVNPLPSKAPKKKYSREVKGLTLEGTYWNAKPKRGSRRCSKEEAPIIIDEELRLRRPTRQRKSKKVSTPTTLRRSARIAARTTV